MNTCFDHTKRSTYILILALIILAASLFFLNVFTEKAAVSKTEPESLAVILPETSYQASDLEERLPFRKDVARFLQVYDTQQFETPEAFQGFLIHEFERFSVMELTEKKHKEIKEELVEVLGRIIQKLNLGQTNYAEQDKSLLKIKQEIEK